MSPDLETLEQLLGGDLPIAVIRGLFDNDSHFARAIEAMLCEMEIRLLNSDDSEVPKWRWRGVLVAATAGPEKEDYRLSITDKGGRRIA